ncbi:hypothetical protein [Pseudoalteromonas sp. 2CM28B]|uniref:hypothetical protein n=1 Tax=Pseudoalteromonas sp. 2CM28B TaxID=2929851 RepID=UPI0020C1366E|nr:hypothetical protein [Pseudoalteromonas sp. 2CM28B]MCK8133233.1 hypothetical protein [Pseudoalteromonas sp. 2CM28B]
MFLNKSKLGLSAIALLISASAFANDTVPAEVYAQTDGAVGGITYTQNKRFIFSYHPFYNPKVKVGELLKVVMWCHFLMRKCKLLIKVMAA